MGIFLKMIHKRLTGLYRPCLCSNHGTMISKGVIFSKCYPENNFKIFLYNCLDVTKRVLPLFQQNAKAMNTHTFNGSQYQLVIENGDLILQGMHDDIIFMGAWDEIYKELEDEFWRSEFCQIRSLSDYVGYEQDSRIICYLFNHKGEGTVLPHCVN